MDGRAQELGTNNKPATQTKDDGWMNEKVSIYLFKKK